MGGELDTQIPPWLQRNWAPREPFDPTPWLNARYQRQIQAQTLPLQIQGMTLQNQAQSLAIEKQGILNDQLGMNLRDYAEQLPRFKEWMTETGGDPVKLSQSFPEGITNPQLVKEIGDLQLAASRSLIVEAKKQKIVKDYAVIADAERAGINVPVDNQGNYNPEDVAAAGEKLREIRHKERMEELDMRYGWHYDENGNPISRVGAAIQPQLQVIDGKKFLINPKTGAIHEISKNVSKKAFIAQHVGTWMRDNVGMTPDQAAKSMSDFYDQYLAEPGEGGAPDKPAAAPLDIGRFKVTPR